jgi:chromosomal replication initiator protein
MELGSARDIWEAALGELQVQITKSNYRTWLAQTIGLSYQDNQFVVGVPNTFVAEYLESNQRSLIEKTLIGLTREGVRVLFRVSAEPRPATGRKAPSVKDSQRYSFDNFIVSENNRLAYAAAMNVAEDPATSYNPLFIFGGVGLGKTHLLHAINNMAQAYHRRTLFVSAEQYTNDFVSAVRSHSTEEFREKYRTVDMLLMDDIQFISGKEQTEESFFHTFNELHNANRQIVVASNRLPRSVSEKDQISSRLEWGLVASIQPPGFEGRVAILKAKAAEERETIPQEVLEYLAHQVQSNIRELEGCLRRAIAYARLLGDLLTPELAARAMEDIAGNKTGRDVTPTLVLEAVAGSFNVTTDDLRGRKRDRGTALARQVAMYLLKQATACSLAEIGLEMGNRDHSTVIHACRKISQDLDNDPRLKHRIDEILSGFSSRSKSPDF